MRIQLDNLWSFVDNVAIYRAVWQAVHEQKQQAPAQKKGLWRPWHWFQGHTQASLGDQLIDALKQIHHNLRSNPDQKKFLLTEALFEGLDDIITDHVAKGVSPDQLDQINQLLSRIERRAKVDILDLVFNEAAVANRERRGAKKILPLITNSAPTLTRGDANGGLGSSRAPIDEQTVNRRLKTAQTYTRWQDHLLRQAMAGAMLGAGMEAVITITYKSACQGRHPWQWDDKDKTDIASAALGGALTGGLSSGAVFLLKSRYPGVPLWVTSAIISGTLHLGTESIKIIAQREDAASPADLAKSLPATLVISLAAYLGEYISPVPLLGAIVGAMTGRIGAGVAQDLIHHMTNTAATAPADRAQGGLESIDVRLIPAEPRR